MVEILIEGESLDLNENTVVAPTFQAANIAEFDTAQANYTNTFKVPTTPRNSRILGNINVFNYESDFNKLDRVCEVRNNGFQVIAGRAIIKDWNDKDFSLVVFSGNFNFFSFIKEFRLDHVNTQNYDHIFNVANVVSLMNTNEGVIYPVVNYGTLQEGGNEINIQRTFFSYYVKDIVNSIFDYAGFEKEGEIFDSDFYKNLVIPFSNKTFKFTTLELKEENVSYSVDTTGVKIDLPVVFQQYFNAASGTYTITKDLPLYFCVDIEFLSLDNTLVFDVVSNTDEFNGTQLIIPKTGKFREKFYFKNGDAKSGNTFEFYLRAFEGFSNPKINSIRIYSLTESKNPVDKIKPGEELQDFKVLINENLPLLSQSDFLKEIAKIPGLVFIPDEYRKIRVLEIDKILRGDYGSTNLSDKLDLSRSITVKTSYANYAQENIFEFSNDTTVTPLYGFYQIPIQNKTLNETNTFIKSVFGATENATGPTTKKIPLIDFFKVEDSGDIEINEISPRILLVKDGNGESLNIKDIYAGGSSQNTTVYKEGLFSLGNSFNSLRWSELAPLHYGQLFTSLQDIKQVDAYFNVSAFDLLDVDFSKRIYVNYFSAYFYVIKIGKVQEGKSTKFTMLRV